MKHFDILEENVRNPIYGKEMLTPEVATELQDYPEDELLGDRVLFVLRPGKSGCSVTSMPINCDQR